MNDRRLQRLGECKYLLACVLTTAPTKERYTPGLIEQGGERIQLGIHRSDEWRGRRD